MKNNISNKRKEEIIDYLKKYIYKGLITSAVIYNMKTNEEQEENDYQNDELDNVFTVLNEDERAFACNWLDENAIKIVDSAGQVINNNAQIEKEITKEFEKETKDFKNYPEPLTQEKEIELFKIMEKGNEKERKEARHKLIEHNLRLAKWVANRYFKSYKVEPEDKEEYARFGLIDAVDHFDYTKGCKLSTYAVKCMYRRIDRMYYNENQYSMSVYYIDLIKKIETTQESIYQELGRYLTNEELADFLNLSVDQIFEARKLMNLQNNYSYEYFTQKKKNISENEITEEMEGEQYENGVYYDEDRQGALAEYINHSEINPTSQGEYVLFREAINNVLSTLTDREEQVLRLRFGLDDEEPKLLEEIGNVFNVTKERIRQIEAKALRKLRHPNRSNKIKEFLESDFSNVDKFKALKEIEKEKNVDDSVSKDDQEIQQIQEVKDNEQIENSEKHITECSKEELKTMLNDRLQIIDGLKEELLMCKGDLELSKKIRNQLKEEYEKSNVIKQELYNRINE